MDEGSGEVPQVSPTEASLKFADRFTFAALERVPALAPVFSDSGVRIVAQNLYLGRNLEAVIAAAVITKDVLKKWKAPSK